MRRFKSLLKRLLVVGLALLASLAVAWAASRAMYPTAAQRDAIDRMEQKPEFPGENAFALLWTLEHDVPEDELSAVMAEDVRRFAETAGSSKTGSLRRVESAAENYPDLSPGDHDRRQFCFPIDESCLPRVRENLDAYIDLIERNARLLDRIEGLHEYQHLRSEFPTELSHLLPPFRTTTLLRTARAVAFASGREEEAVAATCRDIATWRRLGAQSGTMTTRSVAIAYASGYGRALANMLAEWPIERPLPTRCDQALAAPRAMDLSICSSMRGEFALSAHSTRNLGKPGREGRFIDSALELLFFDAEATVGMLAQALAEHCSEEEQERILADQPPAAESTRPGLLRFVCVGNFVGCLAQKIAKPIALPFRSHLRDYGAKLRVLATLAWMRGHAEEGLSPSKLLSERPSELKSPSRDIEFGPEGNTLRVPLYASSVEDYWSIALPPELHVLPSSDRRQER